MAKVHRVRFEMYIDVGAESREVARQIAIDTASAIRATLPSNVKLSTYSVIQRAEG